MANEKKKGWIDKIADLSEEKLKGIMRIARRKEVKSAAEAVIRDLELDISILENQIFEAQKDIISTKPRNETQETTKSRWKNIGELQNKLEAKKRALEKEETRMTEAFLDGEILEISEE